MEKIGLKRFDELFYTIVKLDYTQPISDENITVMDITFSDIPVRLYLPKRKSASQRPAVIFVHGGAFVLGSCSKCFFFFFHFFGAQPCLFYGPTLTSIHDQWKNHSFGCMDLS